MKKKTVKKTVKKMAKKVITIKADKSLAETDKRMENETNSYLKERLKYLSSLRYAVSHYNLAIADMEISDRILADVENDNAFARLYLNMVKLFRDCLNAEIDSIREANGLSKVKHL
jgi:hypothetical protein